MCNVLSLRIVSLLGALLLLGGCGGGGSGGGDDDSDFELFAPQTFSDDFDSGAPAERWGCGAGGLCSWEVVSAGPLAPAAVPAGGASNTNFVFQSPDPQALDLNRGSSCERFSARFEQAGTIAFNYFVRTAEPIPFGQDGNYLKVYYWDNIVEDDPDFGEIIVASERFEIMSVYGNESSRSQTMLPPGNYDFEFCYDRNRTFQIGPDFVQIDNVDTCVGTGCMGEVPTVARCTTDQGETLAPETRRTSDPFTISRVQGKDDRYYAIVDAGLLGYVSDGLQTAGSEYDALRADVESLRVLMDTKGQSCDIDDRVYLPFVISQDDLIDFLINSDIVAEAIDLLLEAIEEYIIDPLRLLFYQQTFGKLWGTALFLVREDIEDGCLLEDC